MTSAIRGADSLCGVSGIEIHYDRAVQIYLNPDSCINGLPSARISITSVRLYPAKTENANNNIRVFPISQIK